MISAFMKKNEFRVLDFGSQCPILPDRTSKMLIREEYNELWKYVESDRQNPRRRFGGVVLTGHPGIGKSFGLYVYLFQNLLAAQPIAVQIDKNSFFIFVHSGVYLVRFTSNTVAYDIQSHLRQLGCVDGMVALVDSSERSPSPAPIFLDPRLPFYVIQATAPRPSRWKEWAEQSSGAVLVTKPWSWNEIFIGSSLSHTNALSATDLHDVFVKYGPVPRVCFNLVGNGREIHAYDRELRREHAESPSFLTVVKSDGFSEAFSSWNSALLMIPDERRLPLVSPISRHIIKMISSRISAADASEIYGILESEPSTRHLAQYLYQTVTLSSILKGTLSYNFTFSSLSYNAWHSSFGLPNETNPVLLRSVTTLDSFPKPLPTNHCYVFSKTENLRSYDAVIRTSAPYTINVYLLKVFSDPESPIFLDELDRLAAKFENIYNGKPGGRDCCDCRWKLIFIVPSSMRNRFLKQRYEGTGKYDWGNSKYFEQAVASV